ncbi:MAG TPA: hypothetical protein VFN74_19990, partial [Chloroflexota bacterium]|nr:hypothetical protein [Chloroflexota bacterium]
RVRHTMPVEARASGRRLKIWASEPVDGREWQLPGLRVRGETQAEVGVRAAEGDMLRVSFHDGNRPVRLTLELEESA